MENKQITVLKNRISELEKSHNRLTAIVVYMFRSRQMSMRQKNRMNNEPQIRQNIQQNMSNDVSNDISNDINNLLVGNDDSNDRANKILEELKKVQLH